MRDPPHGMDRTRTCQCLVALPRRSSADRCRDALRRRIPGRRTAGLRPRVRAPARRDRSCAGHGCRRPVRSASGRARPVACAAVLYLDDDRRRRIRDGRDRRCRLSRSGSGFPLSFSASRSHSDCTCRPPLRWRWSACSRSFTATRMAPRCRNRLRVSPTAPALCWRRRCCTRSESGRRHAGKLGHVFGRRALQRRKRDRARRGRDPPRLFVSRKRAVSRRSRQSAGRAHGSDGAASLAGSQYRICSETAAPALPTVNAACWKVGFDVTARTPFDSA